jgi:starch synthase
MHVCLVTPRYPPTAVGGGEISARIRAETLRTHPRVDELVVLSFDGTEEETHNGVPVRRLGNPDTLLTEWQNLRAYPTLRNAIAEFDIVHAYNMELHPAVGLASDRTDVPAVGSLNSYHFFKQAVNNVEPGTAERLYELFGYPTTGRILRRLIRRLDAFLVPSDAVKRIYEEHGFADQRIETVGNIADPEFEPADSAAGAETAPDDGCSLLYVGQLTSNKGVRHLIESLVHLDGEYHLRVVGDGPELSTLRAVASEHGVESRTEFVGRVPYEQVKSFYATADVFVHPGVWPEPFNRTLLEAMQSGLPAVCTDIGGPPEVIPQSELLCEPKNPESLADAIERACTDQDRFGTENREHVVGNYMPESIVPRIVELYEEVLG